MKGKIERRAKIVLIAIVTMLSAVLIDTNIDEISEPTEQFSFSLFNLLYADVAYPLDRHGDDIGVVLINQESLTTLKETWPPSYAVHAEVLLALLAYKPKAVLIDFLLVDHRNDSSLEELVDVMKEYQRQDIPVFISAGIPRDYSDQVLPEIKDYVIKVSGWSETNDRRGLRYGLVPALPTHTDGPDSVRRPLASPALAIYKHICDSTPAADCTAPTQDEASQRPMWVMWPPGQPDYAAEFGAIAGDQRLPFDCTRVPYRGSSIIKGVITVLNAVPGIDIKSNKCGPYLSLSAHDVILRSPNEGAPYVEKFRNRVIFYGFDLQGLQDIVAPPTVAAPIPGLFAHAAAFENLLSFGKNYLSNKSYQFDLIDSGRFQLITLALLMIIHWALIYAVTKIAERFPLFRKFLTPPPPETESPKTNRSSAEMGTGIRAYMIAMYSIIIHLLTRGKKIFSRPRAYVLLGLLVSETLLIIAFLAAMSWGEYAFLRIAPVNWVSLMGLFSLNHLYSKMALDELSKPEQPEADPR